MKTVTFEEFIGKIESYNPEEVEVITKAFLLMKELHGDQERKSGDPYYTHPLTVAYILAEMHADRDTIIAALCHDVIEDTPITKEEIAESFGADVANLVDGVTKISKMNFASNEEAYDANVRKIVSSLENDVRIIIIKLADRLHNMRTMEFQPEKKQKENSLETMEIFVPLAYRIGAYKLMNELEDLCLRYLQPKEYENIGKQIERISADSMPYLEEMQYKISRMLQDYNIPNEIKSRVKNRYGIYMRIRNGGKLSDINDLLALKIIVDEIDDLYTNCYRALSVVHRLYLPKNYRIKDHVHHPKANMFRSLLTTVFGPGDRLVHTQVQTYDMYRINNYGLTSYWHLNKGKARLEMQKDIRSKCPFFEELVILDSDIKDNREYVSYAKNVLFAETITVYTVQGIAVELPKNANLIDLVYKLDTNLGNLMVGAIINGKYTYDVSHKLNNNDVVEIKTDYNSYGSREEWLPKATTILARKRIMESTGKLSL